MDIDTVPSVAGIYKIVNLVNGKVYVGSAKNLKRRSGTHLNDLRNNKHHNAHLQNSWNAYGGDKFKFTVIELCGREELLNREDFWISELNAHVTKGGYNIIERAERQWSRTGAKNSPEHIAKTMETKRRTMTHVGEHTSGAVLKNEDINKIRCLFASGHSSVQIGRVFGVGKAAVMAVVKGKTWSHIHFEVVDVSNIEMPSRKIAKGESANKSGLKDTDVIRIREMRASGVRIVDIAKEYDLANDNICAITSGKTWKHVGGPITEPKKDRRPLTESEISILIEMADLGEDRNDIAYVFDVDISTIHRILRKSGRNARPPRGPYGPHFVAPDHRSAGP